MPYQYEVIRDVRTKYDYSTGAHEILLSGSVGSAKTVLMAHIIVTHCLMNPGARVLIGRRALPDLRDTLYAKIIEHIGQDLREGIDYKANNRRVYVKFSNGSEIISRSWADTNVTKVRSLDLSMAAIEELTENDEDDFYTEISLRVGRLPHVKEQIIINATNPDSPSHWAYKRFMLDNNSNRHVYYSLTEQNKFLPKQYIEKLKRDLDPKMAERMLYGRWIDIAGETIYYQYDSTINFKKKKYKIDKNYPIHFSFDFNIGEGKPLSVVFFQYIDDTFHFFDEVIVDGLRTESACVEAFDRGLFSHDVPYYCLHGDATGKARTTASNKHNYEIIQEFLDVKGIRYKYQVLPSNPPIKTRHLICNAYMKNLEGAVRLYVWDCATLDEGFRLTKLKKGAQYIEDDSKRYQHCTTAAGYGIYYCNLVKSRGQSGTIQL